MNGEDLKPHDINVTEQTNIGAGGKVETSRRLTFWVGQHGPFTKLYPPGVGTAAQYKLDIQNEIDQLQSLHDWVK